MTSYALRRLLIAIPTIFVIIMLSFFLMHLAPGGPFDADAALEPEIKANLEAAYNLDKPLPVQFMLYLGNVLRGDLGPSIVYRDQSVNELLAVALPVSIQLGLTALVLAVTIGGLLGIWAALKQNTLVDYTVMTTAMTGIAVPSFVTAPLMTLVFGVYLKWLPIAGWNDGALQNMVLPVIALALPQIAVIARLTRGSMVEVMRSNYIRTARAKGIGETRVVAKHAVRAAILPLISYLGPAIAGVVTGSLVVEQIFNLPGVGRFFIQGALNRDYPLVLGIVVVYAFAVILLNLLADLAYAWLDPKVKLAK